MLKLIASNDLWYVEFYIWKPVDSGEYWHSRTIPSRVVICNSFDTARTVQHQTLGKCDYVKITKKLHDNFKTDSAQVELIGSDK